MFNIRKLGIYSDGSSLRNNYKNINRSPLGDFSHNTVFNSDYVPSIKTEVKTKEFNLSYSELNFNFENNSSNINRTLLNFSNNYTFSNKVPINLFSKNEIEIGLFNSASHFNNANKTIVRQELGNFNKGYLKFEQEVMNINNNPENPYDYNYFKDQLVNIAQNSLWFDNSVPSKDHKFQTFIKPLGFDTNNFQLSFNFPFYVLNIEYNIKKVNTAKVSNLEVDLYPEETLNKELCLQTNVELSRASLEVEWTTGKELIRLAQLEYDVSDIISDLHLEYFTYYKGKANTDLEFKRVYKFDTNVPLEYNISSFKMFNKNDLEFSYNPIKVPLEIEYSAGWGDSTIHSLEYNISNFVSVISMEYLASAPYITDVGFEWVRKFNTNYNLNLEYRKVYNIDEINNIEYFAGLEQIDTLDVEISIPKVSKHLNLEYNKVYIEDAVNNLEYNILNIWKDKIIDLEYNISDIWKEPTTNLEYKKVYLDTEINNLEYNIPDIWKGYSTNIETLLSAKLEKEVNIEFLNPIVTKENFQTYVVPFASRSKNFQMYVKCVIVSDNPNIEYNISEVSYDNVTNLQTDIVINLDGNLPTEYNIENISEIKKLPIEYDVHNINKDYNTNLEYKTIYIENEQTHLEFDTSVEMDFFTQVEYNIEKIHKNYGINLETLVATPSVFPVNLQSDIVIEKDYNFNIEYFIKEIQSFYNIHLEFDTSIERDILTQIEYVCSEVSKHTNIEFEILDLVYYFLNKGYNIIPWLYSAGLGNFDETVNKMWNKDNLDNTKMSNGFINQLEYKGYTIPENIGFSNKSNENFGCIIKDITSEDLVLSDKFLVFDRTDKDEDSDFIILGRRKKEKKETVSLKKGKNLLIWDGVLGTFNDLIKPQIEDEFIFSSFWRPITEDWFTINSDMSDTDHDLFFNYIIDEKLRDMPYVFILKVNADCTFEINR